MRLMGEFDGRGLAKHRASLGWNFPRWGIFVFLEEAEPQSIYKSNLQYYGVQVLA